MVRCLVPAKTCADVPASHCKAVPDEEIQEVFKLFDQVSSEYVLSMYLHGQTRLDSTSCRCCEDGSGIKIKEIGTVSRP